MMNFILARHEYPLIVVPTKTKRPYLEALGKAGALVRKIPADGTHASLKQITVFVDYLERLLVMEMQMDTAIAQRNSG